MNSSSSTGAGHSSPLAHVANMLLRGAAAQRFDERGLHTEKSQDGSETPTDPYSTLKSMRHARGPVRVPLTASVALNFVDAATITSNTDALANAARELRAKTTGVGQVPDPLEAFHHLAAAAHVLNTATRNLNWAQHASQASGTATSRKPARRPRSPSAAAHVSDAYSDSKLPSELAFVRPSLSVPTRILYRDEAGLIPSDGKEWK